jgi:hypothetical protein
MRSRCSQGMAMAAVECDNQAGQSMLARRLTTILPAMTLAEALETTRIHCIASRTGDRTRWSRPPPCHASRHAIPDIGLVGGCLVKTSPDALGSKLLAQASAASCRGQFLQTVAWVGAAAGRGVAGAPWRALPGCTARVPPCPRCLALTAGDAHHPQTISRLSLVSVGLYTSLCGRRLAGYTRGPARRWP